MYIGTVKSELLDNKSVALPIPGTLYILNSRSSYFYRGQMQGEPEKKNFNQSSLANTQHYRAEHPAMTFFSWSIYAACMFHVNDIYNFRCCKAQITRIGDYSQAIGV
jgi:hypothetical protein